MYTTLNAIRKHITHREGWETLLKHLGKTKPDDEPLALLTILDVMGFEEALQCLSSVKGFEKEKRELAITYAREVEHLMPPRSQKALDVFERYANGSATEVEFKEARRAAADASYAASNVGADSNAAVWDAASDAAAYARAARTSAADASDAAAYDARAAWRAAHAAACAAARATRSTIKAKQETQLRQLLERNTWTKPKH